MSSPPKEAASPDPQVEPGTVLVLTGKGENDALNMLMVSLAEVIAAAGLPVVFFDLARFDAAESRRFFETVASGRLRFALTYLGIGQDLEVETKRSGNQNIWEFFNVPLLKLQGDLPGYFLERHGDFPRTSVNLYNSEEFLQFHAAVFPQAQCPSLLCDPWLISPSDPAAVDFAARTGGKLVFVKSGGDPEDLRRMWRERLPGGLVRQLEDLAAAFVDIGMAPGQLDFHRLVQAHFAQQGIDVRGNAPLFGFFAAQADDYLRRVKSTRVAQALLPLPVVIQGNRWEHLDTRGAVATLVPGQDFRATEEVFRTQLGVINVCPNVEYSGHDRLMRAAGTFAFALNNRNAWLEDLHPDLNAAGYTFEPESIRTAVDEALRHPERCVELGREFGRRFRARYRPEDFVDRLCTVAELARLRHAKPKPQLQPYMVW